MDGEGGQQYGIVVGADEDVSIAGRKVDPKELAEQLDPIRKAFSDVLERTDAGQKFPLQTVSIGLSITAEGSIVFVGVSATASLELTFERTP